MFVPSKGSAQRVELFFSEGSMKQSAIAICFAVAAAIGTPALAH
jgi:hypothetical protein